MPEPDFAALERQLRAAGVAPRYVRRSVDELAVHFDALAAELEDAGYARDRAREVAAARLGSLAQIGDRIAATPELRCWYFRWPALGRMALPVACVAALPLSPVVASVQHAPILARWGCSLLASGLFTALLLGVLQFTIRFS